MGYLVLLAVLVAVYALVICLMKYMRNRRVVNLVFALLVFIPYACVVIKVYSDVGVNDWNFQNTLPVANVSPFCFALVPISLVLPSFIRKRIYLLFTLLSVGMLMAAVLGCVYNALIHYKFHFHFALDYIAHISLSLWGIYFVKSGQVRLERKNALFSGLIIVFVATVMLILNLILDTAFFGLSLRGKHNIYNNVLVDNSYLSALLYYIGLCGVLSLGYGFNRILNRRPTEKNAKIETPRAIK